MTQDEIKTLKDEFQAQIKGLKEGSAEKSALEALEAKLNPIVEKLEEDNSAEEIETLKASLHEMNEKFSKLSGKSEVTIIDEMKSQVSEKLEDEESFREIKSAINSKARSIDLVKLDTKAVGNVTTSSVTTTTGGNALLDAANAADTRPVQLRTPWIDAYANVSRASMPNYPYVEFEPKDGDASFYAEGAAPDQVDLKATVRNATPVKVGAYITSTEEAVADIPRMQQEVNSIVPRKTALKRQYGILFGDGLSNSPTGVSEVAQLFDGTQWNDDYDVENVNIKDCLVAAATQIMNTHNYNDEISFMPNVVVMNPVDIAGLKLHKDANYNYMFMSLNLSENNMIENMIVIPERDIPQGKFLMGDFTRLNIVNYEDYTGGVGYAEDGDWLKDIFAIKGRTRFFVFVKELDKVAFIYDTFANVESEIKYIAG